MKGGKFQKLHIHCSYVVAACKHDHHEYKNYIDPMYMLESVSNAYRWLFGELRKKAYWPLCHELMISPDPEKKRSTKSRLVSTRILIEMDIQELGQPHRCFVCCIASHKKKTVPHRVGLNQQCWMYAILFLFVKCYCINLNLNILLQLNFFFYIFNLLLIVCYMLLLFLLSFTFFSLIFNKLNVFIKLNFENQMKLILSLT